jgi:hypothetical protein
MVAFSESFFSLYKRNFLLTETTDMATEFTVLFLSTSLVANSTKKRTLKIVIRATGEIHILMVNEAVRFETHEKGRWLYSSSIPGNCEG